MINIEKRITLRPPEPSDFEILYEWFSSPDRYLWTNDRTHYSYQEFCNSFQSKQHSYYYNFMMIESVIFDTPIGFIYAYNYNQLNNYVYTTCYIDDKKRYFGFGALAVMAYYDMWFKEHPIVKICNDVFSYNSSSYACLNKLFHLDGVLRKHRYYNGEYYDVYTFSILREEFYAWFEHHVQ